MDIGKTITLSIYGASTLAWGVCLGFFLRRILSPLFRSRPGRSLHVVLSLIAASGFLESLYFALRHAGRSGLFAPGVTDALFDLVPPLAAKLLHLAIAGLVVAILVKRWLPAEAREREALERGKEAVRQWQTTLDAFTDAVSIHDPDYRIVRLNRAARELAGRPAEEVVGLPCYEVFHCEESPPEDCPHTAVLEEGRPITRKSSRFGNGLPRIVSVWPLKDEEGRVTGTVHISRDLGERERMAELEACNRSLESLGFLAGGIAHDFNNLLAAILGNIALARPAGAESAPEGDPLRAATEACFKARELATRLVTLAPGGAPSVRAVPIEGWLREEIANLARGTGLEPTFDLEADLPPASIDADQVRLVLSALVANAFDAMPSGGRLDIRARIHEVEPGAEGAAAELERGRYILLSVQDEGGGVSPADLERIFDPYFSTKERGAEKGMGLGLAIARSIVRRHGGTIRVESRLGKGSSFHVFLPAAPEGEEEPEEPESDTTGG